MELQQFLKTHKPAGRRSKLDPWLSDITELVRRNYNTNQILEYLESNDVQVTRLTLTNFIKSRIKQHEENNRSVRMSSTKKVLDERKQKLDVKPPSWAPQVSLNDLI